MQNGAIVQQGTPQEVYRQPVNEYVAGLLGTYNLLSTSVVTALTGQPANKKHIVRPEDLRIAATEGKGLAATITAIHFFGSYYEITLTADHAIGDAVHVSLS